MTNHPPGPQDNWLLGSLLPFARDPGNYLLELARKYGDTVSMRILNLSFYIVGELCRERGGFEFSCD